MPRLPQVHVDFVPVPLRDVFASDDLLTALRDRLGTVDLAALGQDPSTIPADLQSRLVGALTGCKR